MRIGLIILPYAICLIVSLAVSPVGAYDLNLAWDHSPDATSSGLISGYKLYYSSQPFTSREPADATLLTIPLGLVTNTVVTNLEGGITYYFAVSAVAGDGLESDLSNITTFLLPPEPPPPEEGGDGEEEGGIISTNVSPEPRSTSPGSEPPSEAFLFGQLPRLSMHPTNGQVSLVLSGTVGATFTIQSSSNAADPGSWLTLTNIRMTVPATDGASVTGNSLQQAFVPAMETWQDPAPSTGEVRFYRIHMPFGYTIVADQVLTEKGYDTRLIAVRLPGISGYIVCYVTEEGAYLDYNDETYVVKLRASGPTIREVATQVAASLTQNWTSASEFTVTEGLKEIVATVVQTDPPELDPPLGVVQPSTITIDF